jgi:hypothetical protein
VRITLGTDCGMHKLFPVTNVWGTERISVGIPLEIGSESTPYISCCYSAEKLV